LEEFALSTATQQLIRSRWPWLAASLILTASLFVSTTLGWLWYADQRATAARQLSLDLIWLEQMVTQSLSDNERLLSDWAHDLQTPTPRATAGFMELADGLMKENPALIAIDYVDLHGRRLDGLPRYAERPVKLPPINDPLIAEAIQRCYTLNRPVYSRVIEQYAPLWVLAVPIADDGQHHSVVLATYDLDQLLASQVPWWFVQRYDVSLVDRDDKQLSPHDGDVAEVSGDVHKLNFGPDNSGLSLRASPHAGGHSERLLLLLSLAVVAFGLLIIWLLRLLQRWLRERQAAQQELRSSREQLYAVLAGLEAAVSVSAQGDGRLLFRNRQHGELFGFVADGECCLTCWPGFAYGTEAKSVEFLDHQSGRWYHVERRTILWVDSSPVTLDIATDVSAAREAADTARQRDELLQHTARLASLAEFASGIAHELNQPLAAIANYSAAAASFMDAVPMQLGKVQEAVRRMGDESRRAGQIIHSMRSFIQKKASRHDTHNLYVLLAEPLALLASIAQRMQVDIAVEAEEKNIVIECDSVMIEQVLFNLIRNALEAVSAQGLVGKQEVVTVRMARNGDSVTVSVSDHGPGISDPDKLFQPFYSTKSDGMGLGLAICRTVIESHGGRLWAEANEGGGARFNFRLPCAASA
jgi:signal transduction histidine kinase